MTWVSLLPANSHSKCYSVCGPGTASSDYTDTHSYIHYIHRHTVTHTQMKTVSHHNRTKESCAGGQGCHWPVSVQMSHMQCAVSMYVDVQSKYNLHTIPQNLLKHITHTVVPPNLENVFCCVFCFFPIPPSVMTPLISFLHILAYMKMMLLWMFHAIFALKHLCEWFRIGYVCQQKCWCFFSAP